MLCAATALAANPAFQDFNTTQFGVGGNKVAVKGGVLLTNPVVSSGALTGNLSGGTNLPGSGLQASSVNSNRLDAATLAMFAGGGGGGDQVWTNDSGIIRPVEEVASTNILLYPTAENGSVPYFFDTSVAHTTSDFLQLRNQGTNVAIFSPFGGLMMGLYSEAGWGSLGSDDGIVIIRDPTKGDNQLLKVDFSSVSDVDVYSHYGEFFLTVQTNQIDHKMRVGAASGTSEIYSLVSPTETSISITMESQQLTLMTPAANDGFTPYTFNTLRDHTSGFLIEVQDVNTPLFTVGWDGSVTAAGALTNTGYSITGTNYATKLRVGGALESAHALSVSGAILATNSATAATVAVTNGTVTASGDITSSNTVFANRLEGPTIVATGVSGIVASPLFRGVANASFILGSTTTPTITVLAGNLNSSGTITATNGFASRASAATIAIEASGWTNSYSVNAVVEVDTGAADLKYNIKNAAGTVVYTLPGASAIWHATAILQPGGALVITGGTTPSGTARQF